MTARRIGLFGGSFDPVHAGHLILAQTAYEELSLDRLYFLPAAQSPFKPDRQPSPSANRLRLLRMALAGQSALQIDDQEIHRGGLSFTIDTAQDYERRFPSADLFYLIGADHVQLLPKWRSASDLARLLTFVIVPRPGATPTPLPAPFRSKWLHGFSVGISSSLIRERIRGGLSIDNLVPPGVAEAIRRDSMYS